MQHSHEIASCATLSLETSAEDQQQWREMLVRWIAQIVTAKHLFIFWVSGTTYSTDSKLTKIDATLRKSTCFGAESKLPCCKVLNPLR